MSLFSFLSSMRSTRFLPGTGRRSGLHELAPVYPVRDLALPTQEAGYPHPVSLIAEGLGAYLLNVHLRLERLSQIERLITSLGFQQSMSANAFETFLRPGSGPEGEAVSLQKEALAQGIRLLLISNSVELFKSLPDLAPPSPWAAFPEVDADGLGALQGSLEYWWTHYWWPYWISLDPQQRAAWLNDSRHPEGWREYVHLQSEFNGIGTTQA